MSDLTGWRIKPQTSRSRDDQLAGYYLLLEIEKLPYLKSYHIWKGTYLKSLYFLPLKFRIEFKIALLTHKCQDGYAPTYLKNLINSRSVSARYSLRVNDDNWLLQTVTSLNFARSQSMFSYALPKVWNSLPLSLREIETLYLFKKRLKAYYFNLAFDDITTVWCQYFAAYSCRIRTSVVYKFYFCKAIWMLLSPLSQMYWHLLVLSQGGHKLQLILLVLFNNYASLMHCTSFWRCRHNSIIFTFHLVFLRFFEIVLFAYKQSEYSWLRA